MDVVFPCNIFITNILFISLSLSKFPPFSLLFLLFAGHSFSCSHAHLSGRISSVHFLFPHVAPGECDHSSANTWQIVLAGGGGSCRVRGERAGAETCRRPRAHIKESGTAYTRNREREIGFYRNTLFSCQHLMMILESCAAAAGPGQHARAAALFEPTSPKNSK